MHTKIAVLGKPSEQQRAVHLSLEFGPHIEKPAVSWGFFLTLGKSDFSSAALSRLGMTLI